MNKAQFKKLQDKWYRKLEKSGFEDIEDTNSPREMLKTWDSQYFLHIGTPMQFEARQIYFEMCTNFLNTHKFISEADKAIWELHTEGFSLREIAKKKKRSTDAIFKTVKRLKGFMEGIVLREATPEDKNFIYSTWLKGMFHGSDFTKTIAKEVFYEQFPKYIDSVLNKHNTRIVVACLKDEKDVVLGYAVIGEPDVAYWVYVKAAWRQQGIAKQLFSGYTISTGASYTKPGGEIMKKKKITYNPWS